MMDEMGLVRVMRDLINDEMIKFPLTFLSQ